MWFFSSSNLFLEENVSIFKLMENKGLLFNNTITIFVLMYLKPVNWLFSNCQLNNFRLYYIGFGVISLPEFDSKKF